MRIYANTKDDYSAKIDTDIIAFHVNQDDVEYIVEFLVTAIRTNCLIEFSESPVEIE